MAFTWIVWLLLALSILKKTNLVKKRYLTVEYACGQFYLAAVNIFMVKPEQSILKTLREDL